MANGSSIEWTQATWNPVTGCSKVSPGCLNCYAERMARRLQAMGQPNYANGFKVEVHRKSLTLPFLWKSPRKIFVNSMSDLFHSEVPLRFIHQVFEIMCATPQHTYQILTKRSERIAELGRCLPWPENVWLGVSVESGSYCCRIDHLKNTGALTKFISFEPLLGPIAKLDLAGIDWVIVGGESGPRARPLDPQWVRTIRDHCVSSAIAFFFKQWGGRNKKKSGRTLDGRVWDQMPLAA